MLNSQDRAERFDNIEGFIQVLRTEDVDGSDLARELYPEWRMFQTAIEAQNIPLEISDPGFKSALADFLDSLLN